MKTYFSELIPRINHFSKKLDNLATLQNQNWLLINEFSNQKTVYIFRENGQLLISENGIVNKGTWEYINKKTIMIDSAQGTLLLNHGFLDDYILVLKLDGVEGYAFFVNESKTNIELRNFDSVISFLYKRYISKEIQISKFYYLNKKTLVEYGPYTSVEILKKFKRGKIDDTVYIRKENVSNYDDRLTLREILQKD